MLVKLVIVKFGFRIVKKYHYYYLCERLRKGQKKLRDNHLWRRFPSISDDTNYNYNHLFYITVAKVIVFLIDHVINLGRLH